MFDLGDDLVFDSYRIPWLIWIQILVMFLLTLTILLCYFGGFALESSSGVSLSTSSPPLETPSSCSQGTQEAITHDATGERATSTSNRTRGSEKKLEKDDSSVKDVAAMPSSVRLYHPCRYLDLAKQAFLKCLGLGSASHNSPDRQQGHED